MTEENKAKRSFNQIYQGERFIERYKDYLEKLYKNCKFMDFIDILQKDVDENIVFPIKTNENKSFKINILNQKFYDAKIYYQYPEYKAILDDMHSRGEVKLSGTISIFYVMQYFKSKEIQKKKDTFTSDADYRKKWPQNNRCEDGHYVRSKNEQLVDNWLYSHGYCHAYEKLVIDKVSGREYISDFYLPSIKTYIEVWGMSTVEYIRRRQEKIAVYNRNGLKLVEITEEEIKILDDFMSRNFERM